MTTQTLQVEGMSCNHCKMAVEQAVNGVTGAGDAKVDLTKQHVTFSWDGKPEKFSAIQAAIEDAGYTVGQA